MGSKANIFSIIHDEQKTILISQLHQLAPLGLNHLDQIQSNPLINHKEGISNHEGNYLSIPFWVSLVFVYKRLF